MIHDLRPYPAMKDSGVPWLGQVPEHWEVVPNRAVFQEVNERGYGDEQMLSVTITQGIIKQRELLDGSSKKDGSRQDKSAYKLVSPGDIAYNKMRAWQGALGASPFRGIVSPAYVVVRPREGNNHAYFHYLMRMPTFAKEAERWSYGITSDMWSLRPEHFRLIYTCVPTPEEQAAIVRFLDHADRRIRKAIAAKQKLIRLLQEQKQVIIHRAVTRGLDEGVKLKPSGVEWLGDVPEHWRVVPLKWYLSTSSGEFISPLDVRLVSRQEDVEVIGGNGVLGYTSFSNSAPDTIAIGRVGALCGNVHLLRRATWITDNALRLGRIKSFRLEYLVAQLRAMNLNRLSNANAQPLITGGIVKAQRAVLPPREEQDRITLKIVEIDLNFASAIDRAQQEISLLREYRTRLVADVVTGKLDVRGAASLLPEPAEEAVPEEQEADVEEVELEADEAEAEPVEA